MAKFVIRNGYCAIAGFDISSLIREVSLNMQADDVDVTSMGAGAHQRLAGLRDDRLTLTAYSDFDSSTGLDRVIWPIFSTSGATTTFQVAANSSTAGATNPVFSGTVVLLTYNPISGAVGDASTTPLEFVGNGGTFNRGTS